jgi:hypothetical protein
MKPIGSLSNIFFTSKIVVVLPTPSGPIMENEMGLIDGIK